MNEFVTSSAFTLLPTEVQECVLSGEMEGYVSYWLQPGNYETDEFREAWKHIGHGGV